MIAIERFDSLQLPQRPRIKLGLKFLKNPSKPVKIIFFVEPLVVVADGCIECNDKLATWEIQCARRKSSTSRYSTRRSASQARSISLSASRAVDFFDGVDCACDMH
jgi:hypothetical protein